MLYCANLGVAVVRPCFMRDDQRLQVSARLDQLLNALAAVDGVSNSIARLLSSMRHVGEAELRQLAAPLGQHARDAMVVLALDGTSRRRALNEIRQADVQR